MISHVVPVLISDGHFPHPSLDVTLVELGTELPSTGYSVQHGLLVVQVASGGAGDKAGLQPATVQRQRMGYVVQGGDVIVAVDGKPMTSRTDLQIYLENNRKPGDTVTLTVNRDGKQMDLPLTLSAQAG